MIPNAWNSSLSLALVRNSPNLASTHAQKLIAKGVSQRNAVFDDGIWALLKLAVAYHARPNLLERLKCARFRSIGSDFMFDFR